MTNTLLQPGQLARLLAERISRMYQIRVSVHLNSRRPEHTYLRIHFEPPLSVSLRNLCRSYREHPHDLEALLQLELQMIADIKQGNTANCPEAVMPLLKSAGWLQDVQRQLQEQPHTAELNRLLIARPLLADLFICYVYKNNTGIHYLTPQESKALGFADTEQLHATALKNLQRRKRQVKFYELEGGAYSLVLDGIYDASLLLIVEDILPEKWLENTVMAIPARNEFLLIPDKSPANLQELTSLVQEVSANTAHPVSDNLYITDNGEIRLYHITPELTHESV